MACARLLRGGRPAWAGAALVVAGALAFAARGAGSPGFPVCTGADLQPLGGLLQGATGSMVGTIRIRNMSAACRVGVRPLVVIRTRSGKLLRTREGTFPLQRVGERQISVLGQGQRAELHLAWSHWCGSWPRGVSVRRLVLDVTLTTGARVIAFFRSGRPRCDVPTPSTLLVSALGAPR